MKTVKTETFVNNALIRYSNKILIPTGFGGVSDAYIGTFLRNIYDLGYGASPDLINKLRTLNNDQLEDLYKDVIGNLKKVTGADKNWEPMYPNFPKQVMEMDEAELYINALIHYFGKYFLGEVILPSYPKEERFPIFEDVNLKILDIGTEQDIHEVFSNLMKSPTSISQEDVDNLNGYFHYYGQDVVIPERIPHKEILASVVNSFLTNGISLEKLEPAIKTATDVLRIAVSLSDCDVSLATKPIFKKFKRSQRRMLLSLLDKCKNIVEDMYKHKTEWIRLGEILHPGEYKNRFQNAYSAFSTIRNEKVKTFNSYVEEALKNGEYSAAAELLKQRPGMFARRLDHMVRSADNKTSSNIVKLFSTVADKISTPVLLQLRSHFLYRDVDDPRLVYPKGSVAKTKVLDKQLSEIDPLIKEEIINICEYTLRNEYKKKEPLGKVYIDPSLVNYKVPFSQRSASKSLKTLVRGSRINLDCNKNTARFFLWWEGSGVDIDLSAAFYTYTWNKRSHVSYTNLKTKYSCHSGDITSAPNGACEFIDINIEKCLKDDIRYVVMFVHAYSNIPFINLKECFAGWMEREAPQSGEVFEAKTVQNKIDLASDSKNAIPLIIDLVDRQVIWADLVVSGFYFLNNIECTENTSRMIVESMLKDKRHNLYDLFEYHALSRGEIVDDPEEADIRFGLDGDVTPFDFDKIVGEYI